MMLDEIDKLGAGGFQGDPASALLEVLDPEQNNTFHDAYLSVPFDLSRVLFIATANVLDTIPGPLRDRMEVVRLSGYTADEKVAIARGHLMPRQLRQNGLPDGTTSFDDARLNLVIDGYTRDAGVRNLEREIGAVFRNVAVRVAEGAAAPIAIDADEVSRILGPSRFDADVAQHASVPGVATGLAWTPVGGDILFIEASRMPGNGKLILTGQLGDVMKESAQAALSLLKTRARPGRRHAEGRPIGRCGDVRLVEFAYDRPRRPADHGDDWRDQPSRAGPAGGRHSREGHRGSPRRHRYGPAAGAQPARL
jgi:ATP-dependent Lon protease